MTGNLPAGFPDLAKWFSQVCPMLKRPLLIVAISVILSVACERQGMFILPYLLLLGVATYAGHILRNKDRAIGILLIAAALSGLFAFGQSHRTTDGWTQARKIIYSRPAHRLRATVTDAPLVGDPGRKSWIEAEIIPRTTGLVSGKIRIYNIREALLPGDRMELLYQPFTPRVPACETSFSESEYFEKNAILASGRCLNLYSVELDSSFSVRRGLFLLRRKLVSGTLATVDGQPGGFLCAIMYGYRDAVSQSEKAVFGRAGTGHLLAISGLHVGLVTALMWFLCRRAGLGVRGAAVLSIIACLFYMGLSGMRPSAVRAAVMTTIYLGGYLFWRKSDALNSLACAGILIVLAYPPAVSDAGFQMSFIAVLFLSRLGHEFRLWRPPGQPKGLDQLAPQTFSAKIITRARRVLSGGWGLLLMSVSAWAGLWPLSALYFNSISFGGILLNILLIPFLPVVISGGALVQAAVLGGLDYPWLIQLLAAPAELSLIANRIVADVDFLHMSVNPPSFIATFAYYLVFFAFFTRKFLKIPAKWFIVPGTLVILATVMSMSPAPPPKNAVISLIPEGYGESIVVELPGGRVYAAGTPRRGGRNIADFLRSRRRTRLDGFADMSEPGKAADISRLREQFGQFPKIQVFAKITPSFQNNPREIEVFPQLWLQPLFTRKTELIGWGVRSGGASLLLSQGWWWDSLMRYAKAAGVLERSRVVVTDIRNRTLPRMFNDTPDGKTPPHAPKREDIYGKTVLVNCSAQIRLPYGISPRSEWGAIRIESLPPVTDSQSERPAFPLITAYNGVTWDEPGSYITSYVYAASSPKAEEAAKPLKLRETVKK